MFVKQTRDKQDIRGKNVTILELKKTTTNQMVQRYAPKVKKASLEVKAVTHRPVVYFVIICFANVLPTIYKFIRVQAPDEL